MGYVTFMNILMLKYLAMCVAKAAHYIFASNSCGKRWAWQAQANLRAGSQNPGLTPDFYSPSYESAFWIKMRSLK